MTERDPGSYRVQDDPWDDFQSTIVPLQTPYGPVTLHFLHAGEVFMVSGYETGEYKGGQAHGNAAEPAFTWKGAEIIGSQNFRRDNGFWLPLTNQAFPGQGYGSLHFSARKGRSVTEKMARDIGAYWAEVIRRYAAEHPLIPAHADLRREVKALEDQETAIREAEQQLIKLRGARRGMRRRVRAAYITEHQQSEPDVTCWPTPYSGQTLNGYVVELSNDMDIYQILHGGQS